MQIECEYKIKVQYEMILLEKRLELLLVLALESLCIHWKILFKIH